MKYQLVDSLACPACGGALALQEGAHEKPARPDLAPEVYQGELACAGCAGRYPIRQFVPDLRVDRVPSQEATVRHYSALWTLDSSSRVSRNSVVPISFAPPDPCDIASHIPHASVVAEAVPFNLGAGQWVLDAGCGGGTDLNWFAVHAPEAQVVGLDLSDGVYVAQRRVAAFPNAHVVRGSILCPPFKRGAFDLVYSYGVLHHTPDPASAFAALSAVVGSGGQVVIYVYTDLREEPLMRLALLPITALRGATRRLPPSGLSWLARSLSPLVFLAFGAPAQALRALGRHKTAARLPFNWVDRPFGARGDLFDRFGAEYEWRHNQQELRQWFTRAGLAEVCVGKLLDRRGWLAWGRRPQPSSVG